MSRSLVHKTILALTLLALTPAAALAGSAPVSRYFDFTLDNAGQPRAGEDGPPMPSVSGTN